VPLSQPLKTSIDYSRIWSISYPIILGSIAQTIINVTDTAFLGRVGEVALGASAIGGIFYLAIIMLGFGVGVGAQIIIARRYGEGKQDKIGTTFEHALIVLILMAIFAFAVMKLFSEGLLTFFLRSPKILEESVSFLSWRSWGVFFAFISFSFRSFYIGITRTKIITWTTVLMAVVNILLDYTLIFGKFGLPELGIEGAAIASVIAEGTGALFFLIFTLKTVELERFGLFHFSGFSLPLVGRIIRLSSPIVLQYFISFTVWFFFFLFVENLGQTPLAISNIIRSVYLIMMLPIWGFSSATNTLVSFLIGQGKTEEVIPVVLKISRLSLLMVAGLVAFCVFSPELIISIYTNNEVLIAGSIPVLYVISVAALIFSVSFVFFNAVSGTGKTQISFIIEVFALLVYFVFIYYITHIKQTQIETVWSVEVLYAFLMGALSLMYLYKGNWRKTNV
jgi:putative MATE family efflux protein